MLFEFKRFWKNKKNWLVVALLPLVLLSFILANNALDKQYQRWFIDQVIFERHDTEIQIKTILSSRDSLNFMYEETQDETYLEMIEGLNERLNTHRNWNLATMKILNQRRDLLGRLPYEIERDEILLSLHETGERNISLHLFKHADPTKLVNQLEIKHYLKDNNIVPLSSPFEMTGTNFFSSIFSYPGFLIWIALATILTIDVFALDMTSGTFKTIYTAPFNRSSILLAKWITSIINVLGIFIAYILLFAAYFFLSDKFGNTSYPVRFGPQEIMPWFLAMLYQLPMIIITIILTITLVKFVSMLIKETNESFVVILTILFTDFLIRGMIPINNKFWYIYPLSGLDTGGLFSNGTNTAMWWVTQSLVLLTTLALLLISITKFSKEDL